MIVLNPMRLYRRWRRLQQEAVEQALMLRRRYAAEAAAEARRLLTRPNLTSWRRQVLGRTVHILQSGKA